MTETSFDFNDGNGLVKAHKHENGGGWVAETANVDKTAFVECNARVSGNASVWGDASVSGNARVWGNARVSGNASVEKSPVNILGIEYNVTIYADFAQVGCKLYKIEEWKKFSADEVAQMDGKKSTEFYPKLLQLFAALGV